jgi:hypothetical protein
MFGVVLGGGPSLQIQPLICAPPLTIVGPVDVLISGGDGLCISPAVFRFEPDFVIGVAEGVIVCIFPPFYRYHPIFLPESSVFFLWGARVYRMDMILILELFRSNFL